MPQVSASELYSAFPNSSGLQVSKARCFKGSDGSANIHYAHTVKSLSHP